MANSVGAGWLVVYMAYFRKKILRWRSCGRRKFDFSCRIGGGAAVWIYGGGVELWRWGAVSGGVLPGCCECCSVITVKECVYTVNWQCNDTGNRLLLHYVGLIPFRRRWRCGGVVLLVVVPGRAGEEPCEGLYPPHDSEGWDDKGVWFAEIFFWVSGTLVLWGGWVQ